MVNPKKISIFAMELRGEVVQTSAASNEGMMGVSAVRIGCFSCFHNCWDEDAALAQHRMNFCFFPYLVSPSCLVGEMAWVFFAHIYISSKVGGGLRR